MAGTKFSSKATREKLLWVAAQVGGLDSVRLEGAEAPNGPFLRGERGGVPVRLRMFDGLRGDLRSLSVPCPGVAVELSVRPELAGERIDKALGMTVDHEVGDPDFDPKFVIESAPMELARVLLSNTVRRALLALPQGDDYPRLTLREGELTVSWRGEASEDAVAQVFDAATVVHEKVSELREAGPVVDDASPFRVGAVDRSVNPSARERARRLVRAAHRRATMVLSTAGIVTAAALAAALLGSGTHHREPTAVAAAAVVDH